MENWSITRFGVGKNKPSLEHVKFEVNMGHPSRCALGIPGKICLNPKVEVRTGDKDFGAIRII